MTIQMQWRPSLIYFIQSIPIVLPMSCKYTVCLQVFVSVFITHSLYQCFVLCAFFIHIAEECSLRVCAAPSLHPEQTWGAERHRGRTVAKTPNWCCAHVLSIRMGLVQNRETLLHTEQTVPSGMHQHLSKPKIKSDRRERRSTTLLRNET